MLNKLSTKLVYLAVIMLVLFNAGCDAESLSPTPPEEGAAIVTTPIGRENILLVVNDEPMINQPQYSPTFTLTETWQVTIIRTLHWNDGNGAEPGQISLKDGDGKLYGPWQAVGEEVGGVQNQRWKVEPNLTLPPGDYTVFDSDPATWSNNQQSEYVGFTLVAGMRGGAQVAQPDAQPDAQTEPPALPLKPVGETPVKANGKAVKDTAGVAATAPVGAVSNGGSLKLVASQPEADFDEALQQNGLKRKSDFYKLEVDGAGDSLPDAVLSFPSAAPGDRVAKLVNGSGLIWADDRVVEGQRVVQAFVGLPGKSTPQYVLLGPAQGANAAPGVAMVRYDRKAGGLLGGGYQLANLLPAAEGQGSNAIEECSLDARERREAFWGSTCRRFKFPNSWSSVEIYSIETKREDWEANLSKVDAFLNDLIAYKNTYGGMGFEKAKAETNRGLSIQVKAKLETPYYDQWTGTIFFGWDEVLNAATTPKTKQTIAHELFHWVEHGTYWMRDPTMSDRARWWLDISAEVATFLIDPSNPQTELIFWGQLSNGGPGHLLGFQETPFEWINKENARYIHALQYFLMMADNPADEGVCLKGKLGFVDSINKGEVGITEGNNYERYSKGNLYLAQYLLNSPEPRSCRVMETGGALVTGRGYGDYIHASTFKTRIDKTGVLSGTDNITTGKDGAATVSASIPVGGVYPLRVSNGADIPLDDNDQWKKPSVPYILKIMPSAPYFYKIGDGKMERNDGLTELVISPITSARTVTLYERDASGNRVKVEKTGIPLVRIVAFSTGQDTVFKATFEPVTPELVLNPTRLSDLAQNPDQELNARLENLLPVVTEAVEFKFVVELAGGGTEEIASVKAAPKNGVAEGGGSHYFSDPDVKEVRVSAVYKLGGKDITVNGVIPVKGSPTRTPTSTATATPTTTPTATATPVQPEGGYWRFVETSNVPDPYVYDDPSRDVHKNNVAEGSASYYHKAISPDLIDFAIHEFKCTWAITSPTSLDILIPGETLEATGSCTDTSQYSSAGTGYGGSNLKFAINPPGIKAYVSEITAFQMGFGYQESKTTTGTLIVPAGPLGDDWNNKIAVVFNVAFTGISQRIYEWVP